jgi:hypothetical protein
MPLDEPRFPFVSGEKLDLSPYDLRVPKRGLLGAFGKTEAEDSAAAIIAACRRTNRWRFTLAQMENAARFEWNGLLGPYIRPAGDREYVASVEFILRVHAACVVADVQRGLT